MNAGSNLYSIACALLLAACNHDSDSGYKAGDTEIVEKISWEIEDPEPPPPNLPLRFKSVEAWLVHLSGNEPVQSPGLTYHFALFQSGEGYVVSLTGMNTFYRTPNHSVTHAVYRPKDGYYRLPQTGSMRTVEVEDRVGSALTEFLKSTAFKNSFLSKGHSITTDWSGEVWKK